MPDVVDGKQSLLFDPGEPVRLKPTAAEIEFVFRKKLFPILRRCHHGRPPDGMSWEDLQQEVRVGALRKLKIFRHGGKKLLWDFAGGALFFALRDIQKQCVRRWLAASRRPQTYPLFDEHDRAV